MANARNSETREVVMLKGFDDAVVASGLRRLYCQTPMTRDAKRPPLVLTLRVYVLLHYLYIPPLLTNKTRRHRPTLHVYCAPIANAPRQTYS